MLVWKGAAQGVLRLHSADTIDDNLRLLHHQKVPAIQHVLDRVVVVPVGHLVRPDRPHDGITHPGQESHGDVRDRVVSRSWLKLPWRASPAGAAYAVPPAETRL